LVVVGPELGTWGTWISIFWEHAIYLKEGPTPTARASKKKTNIKPTANKAPTNQTKKSPRSKSNATAATAAANATSCKGKSKNKKQPQKKKPGKTCNKSFTF
jgi:hypothetical protein